MTSINRAVGLIRFYPLWYNPTSTLPRQIQLPLTSKYSQRLKNAGCELSQRSTLKKKTVCSRTKHSWTFSPASQSVLISCRDSIKNVMEQRYFMVLTENSQTGWVTYQLLSHWDHKGIRELGRDMMKRRIVIVRAKLRTIHFNQLLLCLTNIHLKYLHPARCHSDSNSQSSGTKLTS